MSKLYRMKPTVWGAKVHDVSDLVGSRWSIRLAYTPKLAHRHHWIAQCRLNYMRDKSFVEELEARAYAEEQARKDLEELLEEVGLDAPPEAPRWIPVGERMPPDDPRMSSTSVEVLVCDDSGAVLLGWWDKYAKGWTDDNQSPILGVTHWTPLPQPPKGGA